MPGLSRRDGISKFSMVLVVLLVLVGVLTARGESRSSLRVVNAASPGEELDVRKVLVRGKTCVVVFYSARDAACKSVERTLETLVKKRRDVVVLEVDLDRKDAKATDWTSPLALQYKVTSIPHFMIFDRAGRLSSEGRPAYQAVISWVRQSD